MISWKGESAVVELKSAPYRKWFKPTFWISSARLDSSFDTTYGGRFTVPLYGVGWGTSETESRRESIHDALLWQAHRISGLHPSEFSFDQLLAFWCLEQIQAGARVLKRSRSRVPEHSLFQQAPVMYGGSVLDRSVAVAFSPSREGGVHLASGIGASQALRSLFLKKRRFERFIDGKEQILDRMEDQRLFLYGTSKELKREILMKLEAACGDDRLNPRVLEVDTAFGFKHFQIEGFERVSEGSLERWVH